MSMNSIRSFPLARVLVCLTLTLLSACAERGPVERSWGEMKGLEKVVGNMNDRSYSTGRTQEPRPNALGEAVSMTSFEGSFVWAEYAAPWCPACTRQTPETKRVEHEEREIVFLTIMTSRSNKYDDHATVETASSWAARHSLAPERVLAAELWYKTVPEHRFYSPEGHTLFVHVGALSASQIREVIDYYRSGYDKWITFREPAAWMSFD
jgi:hypothetical protein